MSDTLSGSHMGAALLHIEESDRMRLGEALRALLDHGSILGGEGPHRELYLWCAQTKPWLEEMAALFGSDELSVADGWFVRGWWMLSTKVIHTCPHCQGERLYKNGHTVRGAQRAKCKGCQRTFTLLPKGPRHSSTLKDQVLAAYRDRMSLRGIHRTFGVCYTTVIKWLGEKSGGSARLRGHAPAVRKG